MLALKQVAVILGPESALYGANALAGVINLVSDDNDAPTFVAQAQDPRRLDVGFSYRF
ncbi:MAG: hypothetical protein HYV16_01660 [Gammaproteobacteria bacterium]|nr:hypothetical protein [Gammaproteobacteria bacterium]